MQVKLFIHIWVLIIGLIILVASLIGWFIWSAERPTPPALTPVEQTEEIAGWLERESPNLRVAGEDIRTQILAQQFDTVLPRIESVLASDQSACSNISFRYYAGVIYLLYRADVDRALPYLACAIDSPSLNTSKPYILRLYVMALIQSGQLTSAKKLMQEEGMVGSDLPGSFHRYLNR